MPTFAIAQFTQKEIRTRGITSISGWKPPNSGMSKILVFFFFFWYVLGMWGEVDSTLRAISHVTGEKWDTSSHHAPGNGSPYHLYHICLELPTPNTNKIFPEFLVTTFCYLCKNRNYNPFICSTWAESGCTWVICHFRALWHQNNLLGLCHLLRS